MGKDAGVDTGGMQNMALANTFLGANLADYGRKQTEKYSKPLMDEFMRILGFGDTWSEQKGWSTKDPNAKAYTSPLASHLFQLPLWQGSQAADAAKRSIRDQVRPGMQQSAMLANVDRDRVTNAQTSAFQSVMGMLEPLLSTKSSWATGGQLGLQGFGQAGNMMSQIAQMEAEAAKSQNLGLASIFKTIGTIGGLALGGPFGGALGGWMFGSGVPGAGGLNTPSAAGVGPWGEAAESFYG